MEEISCGKFNELPWHDADLEYIYINRSNPGIIDTICMEIVWPDDSRNRLVFSDVYWANLQLNFGVVARESILIAHSISDCIEILTIKKRWKGHLDNINLKFFKIETNSTGSDIKIVAKNFHLEEM